MPKKAPPVPALWVYAGIRLREVRERKKIIRLTVQKDTPVDQDRLYGIETGRYKIPPDTLILLAGYYEISVSQLFQGFETWHAAGHYETWLRERGFSQ